MNREEYLNTRDDLFNKAQALVEEGKLDEAEDLKNQIEKLDTDFDEAKTAMANMINELPLNTEIVPPTEMGKENTMEQIYDVKSPEYRNAFLKNLLGRESEMSQFENAAYTHVTTDTAMPIPHQILNEIWDLVTGEHSILGDVRILRTGVVIEVTKHIAIVQGKAAKKNEGVANDDEKNTFAKVTLSGNDFTKHVDISYAAANMSIEAFETYLKTEIAAGIGEAMADDLASQIETDMNVKNALTVSSYKAPFMGVAAAMGAIKRAKEVIVYMTRKTLYEKVVTMEDSAGHLIYQPNANEGAEGYLLGAKVKIDDSIADDKILFLDPKKVTYNMVTDIMLETARDIKKHVITYSGYARGEGALIDDLGASTLEF